jgi:hypothetical protein
MPDVINDITDNVESEALETTTPVEPAAADTTESATEAKVTSIDDALAKAIEKHVPPATTDKPAGLLPKQLQQPAKPEVAPAATDPATGQPLEAIKPPPLPVGVREQWGSLDRKIQQYIVDREREHSTTLKNSAEARKSWDEFKQATAVYEPLLAQHKTTALAHAKELLNISYVLNTSSPQHRAAVIVDLMKQFKPDAQTMMQLLQGQQPPAQQVAQPNIDELVEQKLKAREEKHHETLIQSAMDAFTADPANEFIEDVRDLMGKAIDAGLVTGNTYPELFKNAYDFACKNHPEVAAAIAQRQTVVPPTQQRVVAKPNGQVKPSLGTNRPNSSAKPKIASIDDALDAALAASKR